MVTPGVPGDRVEPATSTALGSGGDGLCGDGLFGDCGDYWRWYVDELYDCAAAYDEGRGAN